MVTFGLVSTPAFADHNGEEHGNGNDGTVKVAGFDLGNGPGHSHGPGSTPAHPSNDPHLPCTFSVEWFHFQGGESSDVLFEPWSPTRDVAMTVSGDSTQNIILQPPAGDFSINATRTYTLDFVGDAHENHGYAVKMTITTDDGNPGNDDRKHKVFWVEGCEDVEDRCPAIEGEGPEDPCSMSPETQNRNVDNCVAGTVTTQHQSRGRSFTWNGSAWVPVVNQGTDSDGWSPWVTNSTSTSAGPQCFDQCPDAAMPGNQPAGTPCSMPPTFVDRSGSTTDCTARTVTTVTERQTTTYKWNGSAWVVDQVSGWVVIATDVRQATGQECPPQDGCPDIDGTQPMGTDCENPGPVVRQRSSETTDCEADTVTTLVEESTAEYTMVDNVWVLGEYGPWVFSSETTRDATNKECPPEVAGEQEEEEPEKEKPEVAGEQAVAPTKGVVPTSVAAGLGESLPAQPGRSPLTGSLALLMILLGALLTAQATVRRRRQEC